MMKTGLLETLAEKYGVFISDLHGIFKKRKNLEYLLSIPDESFPLSQWNEVANYLSHDHRIFVNVKDAKSFLAAYFSKS